MVSSTNEGEKNIAVKSAKGPASSRLMIGFGLFLVVAAAVAIPVGIIYSKSDTVFAPPSFPPPTAPPSYSLQVALTASGDVSDYDQTKKDSILSTLATAAGFADGVPAGATLSVTSGSVSLVAEFPVSDSAAMASAKAKLQSSMPDQNSAQTLLAAAVPGIVIEKAPVVNSNDGTVYPPPPPFALLGHWVESYGAGLTFTNEHRITISKWTKEYVPIVEYAADYYVIQKPSDDAFNAKKFQKIFFHANGDGTFSTCTSLLNGETEDAAIAHSGHGTYYANTTQCGQFTHTTISPHSIAVAGSWTAGSNALTISNNQWKSNASWGVTDRVIHAFGTSVAIAQMPADDSFNPSKWVKIHWHDKTGTGFEYCQTTYNEETLLDALKHDSVGEGTYNTSDPNGCGASGFSHSVATLVA